ncbi:MAG: class IV aminotransferase [Hamadaea sp.]|nr:class IV aminotransferase [Hamadaea sp.]
MDLLRVEIDGKPPTADQLAAVAFGGYGHFTAMQVRGGRVRGLDLHLARLDAANRELFGAPLDGDRVRALIRQAIGGEFPDASVRTMVYGDLPGGPTAIAVTVRPPASPGPTRRLLPVSYQRTVAHIKRTGDFGQAFHGRAAARRGYDDALLIGPDGVVSETAIANVAFFDGQTVLWPDAPMLDGITQQLVRPRLRLPARRDLVRLADLATVAAAFTLNSQGVAAVTLLGDRELPVHEDLMRAVTAAYDAAPWDEI